MKPHHITLYGPGCIRCKTLGENTKQAITMLGGRFTLSKETDPMKMAADGVLNTPALTLDGKVLLSGKVLDADELRALLVKALGEEMGACCHEVRKTPEEHKPCGCGDNENAACCNAEENAANERQDGCGCSNGSCCGGAKGGNGCKTLLVLLVLGLLTFAGIRQLEKTTPSQTEAAVTTEPLSNGVVLDYFTFGKRCATCVRMEAWTKEAVEAEFADALKEGRLIMRTQDGDPATIQKYGLTTKSLVLRKVQNGKESAWQNLDRIWELSTDEAAYKSYIAEQVKKAL